ncbi:MAG: hypothetical protein HY044_00275 [Candidatus Woesebacteria bacterium]|nr:MAG: hypothetical protein HY044_00275 [Candidatus Woesebacteria bacterium]
MNQQSFVQKLNKALFPFTLLGWITIPVILISNAMKKPEILFIFLVVYFGAMAVRVAYFLGREHKTTKKEKVKIIDPNDDYMNHWWDRI